MVAKFCCLTYLSSIILTIIILLTEHPQECDGLANSTYYIVQNQGSKNCLTAAGPDESEGDSNVTLFKHGHIISKQCVNLTDTDFSTDFNQQWMLRLLSRKSGENNYQVQLAMQKSNFTDHKLNATLRGEFITYFPNSLDLNKTGSLFEGFRIVDPISQSCLTDDSENVYIQFEECVGGSRTTSSSSNTTSVDFQTWTFSIVNEKELVHHQVERMRSNSSQLH